MGQSVELMGSFSLASFPPRTHGTDCDSKSQDKFKLTKARASFGRYSAKSVLAPILETCVRPLRCMHIECCKICALTVSSTYLAYARKNVKICAIDASNDELCALLCEICAKNEKQAGEQPRRVMYFAPGRGGGKGPRGCAFRFHARVVYKYPPTRQ